jgi:hypothetical protein
MRTANGAVAARSIRPAGIDHQRARADQFVARGVFGPSPHGHRGLDAFVRLMRRDEDAGGVDRALGRCGFEARTAGRQRREPARLDAEEGQRRCALHLPLDLLADQRERCRLVGGALTRAHHLDGLLDGRGRHPEWPRPPRRFGYKQREAVTTGGSDMTSDAGNVRLA